MVSLVGGLALGAASYAIVPASQRLTTQFACPRGTVDSAVVSHVTRNQQGTVVTEYQFRCIDADGGSTVPPGFAVFGLMAAFGIVIVTALATLAAIGRRFSSVAAAGVAIVTLGGCSMGTLTADEFAAQYPYGAGPMLSTGRASEAVRALTTRLGGPPRVSDVVVSSETVSFMVAVRAGSDDRDVLTYRETGFGDPVPMQSESRDGESDPMFTLTPAMLTPVPNLVTLATQRVGIEGGHVTSLSLSKDGDTLEYHVDVEGPRHRGSARFDANGTLIATQIN